MADSCDTTPQYEPYRPGHTTERRDPATSPAHVNGNASGHPHGAATRRPDETFFSPPYPAVPAAILPTGRQALAGIAIRAFGLGMTLGLCTIGTIALLFYNSGLWRLPFFFAVLALFHFLEFYTTAQWNTGAASLDAFLLTSNGSAYNIAHSVAALETMLMHSVFAYPALGPPAIPQAAIGLGLLLLLVGQAARSTAMAQAGTNFNHMVQSQKRSGHELVTTGIYGILRHPSYFGFFWWGLGGQLVLGNVVGFLAYTVVLWRFFNRRIRGVSYACGGPRMH